MTLAVLFISAATFAQQKVKPNKIIGTWEMHIDIKEAIEEESEDMNLFEGAIAAGVAEMVEEIMDEIHITFEFKRNNLALLTVITDLEEKESEVEELRWEIDDQGRLFIDDVDNDKVQVNNDGYWMLSEGKLIAFEKDGTTENNVWMEKAR